MSPRTKACPNPFCGGREMTVIETEEAWSFVCPRCHALRAESKTAIRNGTKYEKAVKRRTKQEEEFRKGEIRRDKIRQTIHF